MKTYLISYRREAKNPKTLDDAAERALVFLGSLAFRVIPCELVACPAA